MENAQTANGKTALAEARKTAITESLSFLGKRLREVYVHATSDQGEDAFAIVTFEPTPDRIVSDVLWGSVESLGWKMTTFHDNGDKTYDLHFSRVEASA